MFDLDGTLFDTAQAIPLTFNRVFRAAGLQEYPLEKIKATIGLPLEKAFADIMQFPVEDMRVTTAVKEYQRQFKEYILPLAPSLLFPGVTEGLNRLKSAGLRLSVTTNKFSLSANRLLDAAGLAHFFDIVVGADDVLQKKPHPESGQRILDFFRAGPERAIMVGDTTHDILMANNLGCKSIAVTYGIHDRGTLAGARPSAFADNFLQVVETCCDIAQVRVSGEYALTPGA